MKLSFFILVILVTALLVLFVVVLNLRMANGLSSVYCRGNRASRAEFG